MSSLIPAAQIDVLRSFNRFYTRRIGTLKEGLLDSPFSLAEARLLYELACRGAPTASELCRDLGLDRGYVSRMLHGFERRGLLRRTTNRSDTRQAHLHLTAKGRKAFANLNRLSAGEMKVLLRRLGDTERSQLVETLQTARALLDEPAPPAADALTLRDPRPGDFGWVVERHGALYASEYGWNEQFEGLVAQIIADYVKHRDPARDRGWIAELDGRRVGAVFLVRHTATVAKLRLLLVEPSARGHGIGKRLVAECIAFARACGYRKIVLWTNSVLGAARRIYEKAGFTLVRSEPHESFGQKLIGETWEMTL